MFLCFLFCFLFFIFSCVSNIKTTILNNCVHSQFDLITNEEVIVVEFPAMLEAELASVSTVTATTTVFANEDGGIISSGSFGGELDANSNRMSINIPVEKLSAMSKTAVQTTPSRTVESKQQPSMSSTTLVGKSASQFEKTAPQTSSKVFDSSTIGSESDKTESTAPNSDEAESASEKAPVEKQVEESSLGTILAIIASVILLLVVVGVVFLCVSKRRGTSDAKGERGVRELGREMTSARCDPDGIYGDVFSVAAAAKDKSNAHYADIDSVAVGTDKKQNKESEFVLELATSSDEEEEEDAQHNYDDVDALNNI